MIQALIQFSLRVPALNFLVMHHESLTETGYCNKHKSKRGGIFRSLSFLSPAYVCLHFP